MLYEKRYSKKQYKTVQDKYKWQPWWGKMARLRADNPAWTTRQLGEAIGKARSIVSVIERHQLYIERLRSIISRRTNAAIKVTLIDKDK